MREIERLVRSRKWDEATQESFRAHLARCLTDDARLGLCERKAFFIAQSGRRSALVSAEHLLTWALDCFGQRRRSGAVVSLLTSRGHVRESVGDFAAAAQDFRKSARLQPNYAVPWLKVARNLLRANRLVATPEVLELESQVIDDANATLFREYAVWTHIVAACCAQARGDAQEARARARQAMKVLRSEPSFESRVRQRHPTAVLPQIDIRKDELRVVQALARPPK